MSRLAMLIAICLLGGGCVTGGANDDPPPSKDAVGLPDDFIEDELDEGVAEETGDEDTGTPDPDAAPPEDGMVEDTTPPPTDSACTPTCVACGADDGCGNPCMTGSCATGSCVAGKCVTPMTPTRSYIAPGDYAFGTAWARGITWTIGAEGPATIRYTLDGSAPSFASPSKAAPAELFVSASGTTIRWYADNGAKEATTHSMVANILTSGQTAYGYIAEKTNLGGKGPVIVASPGATITGSAAYQAWSSSGCPMCRLQVVYGVGNTAVGCLYDWSPNVWPGASGSGAISVKAPTAAGVYDLNVAYTLQASCAGGIATNPIGVRPTASIGKIVVR